MENYLFLLSTRLRGKSHQDTNADDFKLVSYISVSYPSRIAASGISFFKAIPHNYCRVIASANFSVNALCLRQNAAENDEVILTYFEEF